MRLKKEDKGMPATQAKYLKDKRKIILHSKIYFPRSLQLHFQDLLMWIKIIAIKIINHSKHIGF